MIKQAGKYKKEETFVKFESKQLQQIAKTRDLNEIDFEVERE